MSPTMNSSRSLGPRTRLSSGAPSTSVPGWPVLLVGTSLTCGRSSYGPGRGGCAERPRPGAARDLDAADRAGNRSAEEDLSLGVLLGRDDLELARALDQGDPDDVLAAQRHHRAVVTLGDRVDRGQPEAGRHPPVAGGRGAAALHVPEHDRARLLAGALLDLGGDPLADAPEPDVAEGVALPRLQRHLAALARYGALGDDQDRRVVDLEAALDVLDDLVDVEGLLGDQDDVGAGRHPGVQRDPPGVAP